MSRGMQARDAVVFSSSMLSVPVCWDCCDRRPQVGELIFSWFWG